MSQLELNIEQMRGMIGLQVSYHGARYLVIEVLEDGPSLVLMDPEAEPSIQLNLHGNASRRVPCTETINVLSRNDGELHPDFLALQPY